MNTALQNLKTELLENIEENSQWVLGSLFLEQQLVEKLVAAISNNLRHDAEKNLIAPNIFLLNVPANSSEAIRTKQNEIENLERMIVTAGGANNIQFKGQVTINIFPDEVLKNNDFKILAIWKDEPSTKIETQPTEQSPSDIAMSAMLPKAFLIVEGTKIFTLDQDITNIGRNMDNHLVLDDIRVSRTHAQIRVVKGRHMLFDLDSSGGTFINNKRISKMTLHPGDVISLAGIPLVYGQDALSHVDESNEYTPPKHVSNESTTTIKFINNDLDKKP